MLLLALVSGCASYEAYRAGMKNFDEGNFDQSVQNFQKSVELSPEDEDYQAAFKKAKLRASEYHYCYGQELFRETCLAKSKDRIEKALSYTPDNKKIADLLKTINENIRFAKSCFVQAKKEAKNNSWDNAVASMRIVLGTFKTYPDGNKALEKILQDASIFYIDKAQVALSQDKWDIAESMAKKEFDFGKKDQVAKNILQEVANRRKAKKLTEQGDLLFTKKDYKKAFACFMEAKGLYNTQPGLDQKIQSTKVNICKIEIAKGGKLFSQEKFVDALECYCTSKEYLPLYGNIDNHITRTRQKLADVNLAKGKDFLNKSRYANAFFHFACAYEHQPDNGNIKRLLVQAKEKINDKIRYRVALVNVSERNDLQVLNGKLAKLMLKSAKKSCAENVEVATSPDIERLIPRKTFDLKKWCDSNTGTVALNGVDGIILYSIDNYSLAVNRTKTKGTSHYVDGTRWVRNPEYDRAKQRVMAALGRLRNARSDLSVSEGFETASAFTPVGGGIAGAITLLGKIGSAADAGSKRNDVAQAEAELANAQVILSNTPNQIEVPRRFIATYPIYMVHAHSELQCSFKAFDILSRRLLDSKNIAGEYKASDRHIVGNDRMNIPDDPLELPGRSEFEDASLADASSDIREFLLSAMRKHGERFIYEIGNAKDNGNQDKLIENCIYYILSYPEKSFFSSNAINHLNYILGKESKFISLDKRLHNFETDQ